MATVKQLYEQLEKLIRENPDIENLHLLHSGNDTARLNICRKKPDGPIYALSFESSRYIEPLIKTIKMYIKDIDIGELSDNHMDFLLQMSLGNCSEEEMFQFIKDKAIYVEPFPEQAKIGDVYKTVNDAYYFVSYDGHIEKYEKSEIPSIIFKIIELKKAKVFATDVTLKKEQYEGTKVFPDYNFVETNGEHYFDKFSTYEIMDGFTIHNLTFHKNGENSGCITGNFKAAGDITDFKYQISDEKGKSIKLVSMNNTDFSSKSKLYMDILEGVLTSFAEDYNILFMPAPDQSYELSKYMLTVNDLKYIDSFTVKSNLGIHFDADKKFGIDTRPDNVSVNFYAIFNLKNETLSTEFTLNSSECSDTHTYEPTARETKVIHELLEEYCQDKYNQPLNEYFKENVKQELAEMISSWYGGTLSITSDCYKISMNGVAFTYSSVDDLLNDWVNILISSPDTDWSEEIKYILNNIKEDKYVEYKKNLDNLLKEAEGKQKPGLITKNQINNELLK